MRNVYFQYQGILGDWVTVNTSSEPISDTEVMIGMRNVKLMKPDSRVRVIDHDGRLMDMLP